MMSIDGVGAHGVRNALCLALAPLLVGAALAFCSTASTATDEGQWYIDIHLDSTHASPVEGVAAYHSLAAKERTLAEDVHSDADYSALRDFVQQIDSGQFESPSALPRLAQADNAFDALREFFNRRSEPTRSPPSQAPKASRAAAPLPKREVVDATIVG